LQPKNWKAPSGYSNGVVSKGNVIFVSGQVAWNENYEIVSDDFVEQVKQTLENIITIIAEADGKPEHITRLTWFVKNKHDYLASTAEIGKVYRSVMGKHFPAMSLVEVSDLLEDSAKVEIEAINISGHVSNSILADFAFAMQGLGSGPISLFGSETLKSKYLPEVSKGKLISTFALSEKEAGTDVASMITTAKKDGSDYILNGEKTWISNAGIADFYVLFARTGEAPGAKGISAFVVQADTNGFEVSKKIPITSPHPLGTITLTDCRTLIYTQRSYISVKAL
ncbi:unnamed protein product, partial [marine sediment metagenome]